MRMHSGMMSALNLAVRWKWIPINPARDATQQRIHSRPLPRLTREA